MQIPRAKAAVDGEWDDLFRKNTWNVNGVRPRAEVIADAKARNISVHFVHLMAPCLLKHKELAKILQGYNGRIVFRGDQVKDETGFF